LDGDGLEERFYDVDYVFVGIGEEFVGDDFVGIGFESGVETLAPGDAEFGVDVDEVEAGVDTGDETFDGSAGAAVESEEGAGGGFDLADAVDVDVFVLFAGEHGFQHAVHGADAGSEEIDLGGVDELPGLFGSGEGVEIGGRGVVDGGGGANEAEFGFDEDIRIDGF